MRLCQVQDQDATYLCVETPQCVMAFAEATKGVAGWSAPDVGTAFIESGPESWKRARDIWKYLMSLSETERKKLKRQGVVRSPAEVQRLAPLRPRAVLCSGHNYSDHREEKPPVSFENPEYFLKLPDLVIGPGEPIVLDHRVTRKLDHETELAIVIGRKGRHIPAARALDYVFGYTIMNDVTARDQQIRLAKDGGYDYFLGPGKNFDTAAPLGPAIVTKDEIPAPQGLRIRSWVNGEPRQDASTAQMIWGVRELIAYFSKFVTLHPGYVISTGTPGRTAWGWDADLGGKRAGETTDRPKRLYLDDGDVVRCEIEQIGVLENPVRKGGPRASSRVRPRGR